MMKEQVVSLIHPARNILIISHVRPDGDAIGSLLGLGLSLQESGKQVEMVLVDGVPDEFRHLPGSNQIVRQTNHLYDLAIVVDSSDLQRIGGVLNGNSPDMNIDHHVTNTNFAKVNVVKPDAPATCALLAEVLPQWGLPVTADVAANLLTGVITDTLGFRTSNVTPQTLRTAADLIELGAKLPELYHQALVSRSYEAARYWGCGLGRLQRQDRLVWTSLTLADRAQVSYPGSDDADLVNVLSTIRDCDIAVMFIEQRDGKVKISWRAETGFDVSGLAYSFGGGGHAAAAGADIPGTLEDVRNRVLQATRKMLQAGIQKKH